MRNVLGISVGWLACLTAIVANADQPASDRAVWPRQHVMEIIGQQTETLRLMAAGQLEFDARAARMAAGEIGEYARRVPELYTDSAPHSHSDASPRIWKEFEDFQSRSMVLADVAEAACEDIESLGDLQAAYVAIQRTCQSCHDVFTE